MSFASISFFTPSLKTFAFGDDSSFKESNDFCAFTYWTVPNIALRTITAIITMVLSTLPDIIDITEAIIKIITSRSANWLRKILKILFLPLSINSFLP